MYVLEATGIRKVYGGVVALEGCDFRVEAGTVHALLGENGAGKSTLVKILTGAVLQDAGTVKLAGESVQFADSTDAARKGVAVVSQELNLFPDLDVLRNLFMQRTPLRYGIFDRASMERQAKPVLEELGLHISTRTLVGTLSLAEQQLIEIAKAMVTSPRVLILDEPTSALDDAASSRLLDVIRALRDRGVGVVFVSHILEEVMALSDVVTVLRDGVTVMSETPRSGVSIDSIVRAMVGDAHVPAANAVEPGTVAAQANPAPTAAGRGLVVEDVTVPGRLNAVSLQAAPGEIVGMAGVVGAGHQDLLDVIAGAQKSTDGSIQLPGTDRTLRRPPRSMRHAVRHGVAVVSGDRKRGLFFDRSIWSNVAHVHSVSLGRDGLLLRRSRMKRRAAKQIGDLNIKTPSADIEVRMLSGGNQQKVVMAKWLEAQPSVLLLDDPTRGVAIGSKADFHNLLRKASENTVVLLCSTDLDELISVCNRVLVFRKGSITAELSGERLNRQTLLTEMNIETDAPAD